MLDLAVGFAIAVILMVIEYLVCTRLNNALWGGIIPILILIGTVWIFASGKVPLEIKTILPFIICNSIFFGEWDNGRKKYSERKKPKWIK
ncbi:hypothetical protein NXH76_27030 [Blautia schinkii]|nr:hypothetical protein [Blautia schinkii]